ncbi:hypothetical protein [Thioclava sp. JE_KL1]|uniref:hypothetical protein n=1 Tax=Thioclava sp. JE_KL1 TaxID=2651187 RepID=UPI00128B7F1B|nr:hypothetical protein [Thioclava sp. JE_KL1]MPQ96047.1 hypothetical protein [Thioclava sp. JE_KL1]
METTDLIIVIILSALSLASALAAFILRVTLKPPSGVTQDGIELFRSYNFPEPSTVYDATASIESDRHRS